MNYEKKYKEALEVAQKLYQDCPNGKNDRLYHTTDLEKMFPELRESEDEKIRKELIEHVKDQQSTFISAPDCIDKYEEEENNKYNVWIAWLEKQDPKKHEEELEKAYKTADKVQYKRGYEDAVKEMEKQGEQKLAWSKEDQNALEDVREAIVHYWGGDTQDILLYWLKSIKQKIKGE